MNKLECAYSNNRNHKCTRLEVVPGSLYCNLHLNKVYNVKIEKSTIPGAGNGLFAGSNGFKKDDIILEYSRNDVRKKAKNSWCSSDDHKCYEYLYCDAKYCWDARYRKDIIARYPNDSRSSKNNAYFEDYRNRAFIVAGKNIAPGAEILVDYGSEYDWSFLEK